MAERMNYRSLAEFVADLDAAGELVRISEPVDPVLEVAEIADRVMKQPEGGKGLLFSNVKGSQIPLGINLFGSTTRMGMALGVSCLDDIGDRLSGMLKLDVPDSLMGKLAMLPMLKEIAGFPPRRVRSGPKWPYSEDSWQTYNWMGIRDDSLWRSIVQHSNLTKQNMETRSRVATFGNN